MKDITINDILKMLLAHIKLIVIVSVVAALGAYIYADNFIPKMYSASTKICIQKTYDVEEEDQNSSNKLSSGSITSSTTLADNSIVILTYAEQMLDKLQGCYHSISSVNESNVLTITVTGSDPNVCAEVANDLAEEAPKVLEEYYSDAEAQPIGRPASAPGTHSSPNETRYALIGFIGGLIISILIAIIIEIIDTTIKPDDNLYKIYDVPVLGEIIDFETEGGARKK